MKKVCLPYVVFAVLALAATSARAESEDCAQLPEARQAMCWMVLSCAAIGDVAIRQECFQEAYDGFRRDTGRAVAPGRRARPETPAVAEQVPVPPPAAPPSRTSPPARSDVPVTRRAEPAPRAPAEEVPEDRVAVVTESTQRQVLKIPERFDATITYHRDLVRDRQLFVLDGMLLFEGNAAVEGRLRRGQKVEVIRSSSLLGEQFKVTGTGRSVEARRIPCEQKDLSKASRTKCAVLGSGG